MEAWLRAASTDYASADDRLIELERAKDRLTANLADVRRRLRAAGAREELADEIERVRNQLRQAEYQWSKNRGKSVRHNEARRQYALARTPRQISKSGDTYTAAPMVSLPDDERTYFDHAADHWDQHRQQLRKQLAELESQVAPESPRLPDSIAERLGIESRMSKLEELRAERRQVEADLDELAPLIAAAAKLREVHLPAARRQAAADARRQLADIERHRTAARQKLHQAEIDAAEKLAPLKDQVAELTRQRDDMQRLTSDLGGIL